MATEVVFRSFIVVDEDRLGDFLGDDFKTVFVTCTGGRFQ